MRWHIIPLMIVLCICFVTSQAESNEDEGFCELPSGLYEVDNDFIGTFLVKNDGETAIINIWDSKDAYNKKDDDWDESYKHFYSVPLYSGSSSSVTLKSGELMQVISYDSKCKIKRYQFGL